jgi:hypothetical protein
MVGVKLLFQPFFNPAKLRFSTKASTMRTGLSAAIKVIRTSELYLMTGYTLNNFHGLKPFYYFI